MSFTVTESEFNALLCDGTPLIDVRAPTEYQRGAFPNAVNLPLLDDEQRQQIGKQYKNRGQQAAIELGNQLVSGDLKQQKLQQWKIFLQENPTAVAYCFRGGLRSHTVQQWLHEIGVELAVVSGGYKALRRHLINVIETSSVESNFMIIGGKTGSAKTHLLRRLKFSIDLEGLANHRGYAFGKRINAQPVQINFENQLAIALLQLPIKNTKQLFLEDESRAIGSLSIPKEFYDKMTNSPIAMVEESLEARIDTIYRDYIYSNFKDFQQQDSSRAQENFAEFLLGSLQRISRRLGGEKFAQISAIMKQALNENDSADSEPLHREWIARLLCEYYDPMYAYQSNKKLNRVVFRGSKDEFLAWAAHLNRQS